MDKYWDIEWKNSKVSEYQKYINPDSKPKFFEVFEKYDISHVCDAACGFGAYSVMLNKNGYKTSGFDISENSVNLTKNMLEYFNCPNDNYKACSITDIDFDDECFDAVVAHAVIDHLSVLNAQNALKELFRIVRRNGLIYISFDGIEDDDLNLSHEILEDGAFLYTDKSRNGLLFKYYLEEDINNLIIGREKIYYNITSKGDREVIIRK